MKLKMNVKNFVAVCAMGGLGLPAIAQIDSTECKKQYSLFNEYYRQKNFEMAREPWKYSFNNCEDMYLGTYVYGVVMYKDFYRKAADDAAKKVMQDSLVLIYDKYLAQIEKSPGKHQEKYWNTGQVLASKATDLQAMDKNNYELTYPLFEKALALNGNNTPANAVSMHIYAAALMKSKSLIECDKMADLYLTLSDVVDYNFNASKDSSYLKAQANLDKLAENCLDCTMLVENFSKQFEASKKDTNWIRKAASLLDKKKCLAKDEHINNATVLGIYEIDAQNRQSADAFYKLGMLFLAKKDNAKAEEYIEKAVALESNNEKKAEYTYTLAQVNYQNGRSSTARDNARKAAGLKPGWGDPYIFIGDLYASAYGKISDNPCEKAAPLWAAADKYNYAKSIDPSCAEKANKQLGRVQANYPPKDQLFFDCPDKKEGDGVSVGGWIQESTTIRTR